MALLSVCVVALLPFVCFCVIPLGVHVWISQPLQAFRALTPTICKGVGLIPTTAINVKQRSTHLPVDMDCA